MTKAYNDLPKIVKIILQLFLGSLVGGIYRICRFLETKNVVTLVVGVLVLVTVSNTRKHAVVRFFDSVH